MVICDRHGCVTVMVLCDMVMTLESRWGNLEGSEVGSGEMVGGRLGCKGFVKDSAGLEGNGGIEVGVEVELMWDDQSVVSPSPLFGNPYSYRIA
jgi:hypothetical protein